MKKYLLIFLLYLTFLSCYSQNNEVDKIDGLIDELLFNNNTLIDDLLASFNNYQFLYISVTYNSDSFFSGRDINLDQINMVPQIIYAHSNGFYIGLTGTYYSKFYPKWDATTAFIGFNNTIGKKKLLKYSLGYSKFFYTNNDDSIYGNTIDIGLGVQNKERTIGTQISGSYLFGKERSIQVSSRSYVLFTLLNSKSLSLKLRPQLNIVAGKQTYELSRILNNPETTSFEFYENEIFDLINTQINIPLELTYNSFDFEVGYNFNFPNPIGAETQLDTTGFFNFSISYLIDL